MGQPLKASPAQLEAAGKRLSEMMKKRALTAHMLAKATGISPSTIYQFVHGKRDMHLDDLREIGSALQVSPSWIAWGD